MNLGLAARRPVARSLCLFCSARNIHTAPRKLPFEPSLRPIARLRSSPLRYPAGRLLAVRYKSTQESKTEVSSQAPVSLYGPEDTRSYDALFNAINEKLFKQTDGDNPKIPRETEVVLAFKALQKLASNSTTPKQSNSKSRKASNPNDAVLSLAGDAKSSPNAAPGPKPDPRLPPAPVVESPETIEAEKAAKMNPPVHPITDIAYHIVIHPFIFISPKILSEYVKLAAILKDPSTLPSIFRLYGTKPIMTEPGKPGKKPWKNSPKNAIEIETAREALQVAISAKNMPMALDIIDYSVGTSAWARKKLVTKFLPFTTVAGAIPLGLWKLSDWLAHFQEQWMHEKAMAYAFIGFMAYYICTGTLGMIALLTWNDHMIRVNWIPGVYMRERWFMEEQRALADRVAMAWGFQEPHKRGLETGWEWEMLRHWAGVRGMIIDSSEMVEGRELTAEKEAERLAAQGSLMARWKLKMAKPSKKQERKRLFES